MIAMGVDPGTHTISAAVLEGSWQRPILRGVLVLRPQDPEETDMRKRVISLSLNASMLGAWVEHFKVDDVVVEGQHFHDHSKVADDIICLAAVAGACLLGAQLKTAWRPPTIHYPAAGDWSKMDKTMRANRIKGIYMPGLVERATIQKLTPCKLDKREYGDVLDAIGMAYWALKGYPRAGV